jgi:hypothetical protein
LEVKLRMAVHLDFEGKCQWAEKKFLFYDKLFFRIGV